MQFGANWIRDDPSGKVVNLPSASLLSCLYEEATSPGGRTKCDFDEQDLSQFATLLGQALAMVDQEQVNHLYFVWSLGSALDESLLERWLASVDPYVARGQVVWKTMPEIYDDYLAWEATHG
jgi:hypothetical protein